MYNKLLYFRKIYYFVKVQSCGQIAVAAWLKAWICGRSLVESHRGEGRGHVVSVVCCQVEVCASV
jgi:hypothetical protein